LCKYAHQPDQPPLTKQSLRSEPEEKD